MAGSRGGGAQARVIQGSAREAESCAEVCLGCTDHCRQAVEGPCDSYSIPPTWEHHVSLCSSPIDHSDDLHRVIHKTLKEPGLAFPFGFKSVFCGLMGVQPWHQILAKD